MHYTTPFTINRMKNYLRTTQCQAEQALSKRIFPHPFLANQLAGMSLEAATNYRLQLLITQQNQVRCEVLNKGYQKVQYEQQQSSSTPPRQHHLLAATTTVHKSTNKHQNC